jgi:Rrf2 family protein
MKFSAQEEYGLRCLLRVARAEDGESVTIPAIAEAEALSSPYVGKLMSVLRQEQFVKSVRGQAGGYVLARPSETILLSDVLAALGGRLFEPEFCDEFTGLDRICTNSIDCSIRSVWRSVQVAVDRVLNGITLKDLLRQESEVQKLVARNSKIKGQSNLTL